MSFNHLTHEQVMLMLEKETARSTLIELELGAIVGKDFELMTQVEKRHACAVLARRISESNDPEKDFQFSIGPACPTMMHITR